MMFDYLHAERPTLIKAFIEAEVPQRLHAPLVALAVALLTACCAWGIESMRLSAMLRLERSYQMQYLESQRSVDESKVRFKRLEDRAALDRRVAQIRSSGAEEALRLADIANDLPADAWLTAVGADASGVSIEGRASNLRALANSIDRLAHAKRVRNPVLLGASADGSDDSQRRLVRYRVHVDPVE